MVKHKRLLPAVSALLLGLSGCLRQPSPRPFLSVPRASLDVPPATAPDNRVYVVEEGSRIRALDENGKEQWVYSVADGLADVSNHSSRDFQILFLVARTQGRLFGLATQQTGARAGQTYLFATVNNRSFWQKDVPPPTNLMPPVAVDSKAVYEAGSEGILHAFAQTDGHLLWQRQITEGPLGSLTIGSDGTIYVIGPLGRLHAITPDGSEKWAIKTHG